MKPTYFQHRLPNGLTIIAEPNDAAHSFAAGLFVRIGSRDEPVEINGVSHFLEHMMFKGSSTLNWQDMNRIFDEMGARYNAFTTQEMTAYYANVLPQFTAGCMEHLQHLFEPALRQDDFDTEKNVILEEIAMYADEPGQRVYTELMARHFADHALGRDVLGTPESIKAMTRDQMAGYFQSHYGPQNMIVAVAGRFDLHQLLDLSQQYYGHWSNGGAKRSDTLPVVHPRRHRLVDPKLNRTYIMGMTPGPSAQDDARFAARVLADLIGDSDGSRFYWALVDNAITEDADFGFYPHDRCGSFYLSITASPDRAEKSLDIAMKELSKVVDTLTDDEIDRARNKLVSSITVGSEVPMGRMRAIGSEWVYNESYRSLQDELDVLASIDRRTLLNLLGECRFDQMTIVTLEPE
jgi:predicted Zn-dependent peptidase